MIILTYRDAQVARTTGRLAPGALQPREARIGMPADGFKYYHGVSAQRGGMFRRRSAIYFVKALFVLRPCTVWGFQRGDVLIRLEYGVLVIFVRVCKPWPELKQSPARREVPIPDDPRPTPPAR